MFKNRVIIGHLRKPLAFVLVIGMLMSLFGAGVVIAESIPPTGIELDEQTLDMFAGESRTLTATILPENADSVNIIWSSDDENVATVANGVVTAIAAGTTTIRATIEGMQLSAECAVNVNELVITERSVIQDTYLRENSPDITYGT